jgi:23S rRNA G2069 N7-methylase RlmK/C1962 C5-methylase RlmI
MTAFTVIVSTCFDQQQHQNSSHLLTHNIYFLCLGFDWLARLAKRNEQFDIVILDPPSTSVNKFQGRGKKRWSVKSDMDELVALAARLVKSDGILMTTTNAATLRPEKFAKMCFRGLKDAGIQNAKLERISPMPSDFPSIGCEPVTNLIWRIP